MRWNKEDKYDLIFKSISLTLNPVLGMLASLVRINTRSSFIVFFLSYITFGVSICTPDSYTETFRYDTIPYRNFFEDAVNTSLPEFAEIITDYLKTMTLTDYLFFETISFILTRFTSNYHVLFLTYSILFCIFTLKSMHYLVSESNYHFSISSLLLLFVFTLAGISTLSVLRWFMAYWIAVYALFRIHIDKDNKYYLLLIIAALTHTSLWVIFILSACMYVVRKFKRNLILSLLIISLFLSPVILKLTMKIIPLIFGEKFSSYINIFYVYQINESGTGLIWLRRLLEELLLISNTVVVCVFTWNFQDRIKSTKCESLYYFLIVLVLFVNLTITVPSVGSRFIMFAYPLIAYIFLVCFYGQKFRNLIYLYSGFILCCILTCSRFYLLPSLIDYAELWEPSFYILSPIYSFVKYLILY